MQEKWYITFTAGEYDWDDFQERLELVYKALKQACEKVDIVIEDLESK